MAATAIATLAIAVGLATTPASPSVATADRGQRYRPNQREIRLGDRVFLRKHRIEKIRRKIAPGLIFTKIIDRRTPRRIFILRADVANYPLTFDVSLGDDALPALSRTSATAQRNGALGAINGDLNDRPAGRPRHPFAQDGHFLYTALQRGSSFAVSPDEQQVFLQPATRVVTATNTQTGARWSIDRWNHGSPSIGEIAGFSPLGGTVEMPPPDSCSIHLNPSTRVSIASPTGLERTYVVDARACATASMPVGDGVVLSAVGGTEEATQLMALTVGTSITIRWDTGIPNALDVLSSHPILVQDGLAVVSDECRFSICHVDPRTGIAVQADGRLLMVVVDGRQPKYSIGLTQNAFARLMRELGAVKALGLDGGGSSTMVIEGEVVNRPSDGSERYVATAAMILPGPDPGEEA